MNETFVQVACLFKLCTDGQVCTNTRCGIIKGEGWWYNTGPDKKKHPILIRTCICHPPAEQVSHFPQADGCVRAYCLEFASGPSFFTYKERGISALYVRPQYLT